VVVPHVEDAPPGVRLGDQPVGVREGHRQGILHQDVLPRLEGRQGDRGVAVVVGGDEDGVDVLPADRRLPVVDEGGATALRQGPPGDEVARGDAGDRRPLVLLEVRRSGVGHPP
jgi:hypothetical protein